MPSLGSILTTAASALRTQQEAINVVGNYQLLTDWDTCYYTFLDPYWCGTSEALLKLSFWKVTERDYEPLYYPDNVVLRDNDGDPIYPDQPDGEKISTTAIGQILLYQQHIQPFFARVLHSRG